ncbi:MFS transporter [Streptomyces sp. NPDC005438]|uniref:MFS transporter n=1 Tax=Streptomyces sp. NPDC005438 TaxID=3156880 RepID=UPI0033A0FB89
MLVVLCVSLFLVALDATVLHLAVPEVSEDLRPSGVQLLWMVDVYPLVCASLLILFGVLGDRVGRRRVLLLGYVIFGCASALAAFARTPEALIGARALLGVGGSMIMPATLSILRQVFPDRRERALAVGVWSAVAAVGAAAGPLMCGLLLQHFWWGSVFLVNVPLMVLSIPVGRAVLPESRGGCRGPWDWPGAVLAAAGLFALTFALKRFGAETTALDPLALATLVTGAVLLTLFVLRQRRAPSPLVDLGVLARPGFGLALGCITLAMLALVGLMLIAAQYLQLILDLTPLQTGLRLLPLAFAAVSAGLLGPRMLAAWGPRRMVAVGFVLTATGVLSLSALGQQDDPRLMIAGFVLLGYGLETTLFGSYESMLSEAPVRQAGAAAAMGETSYQLGAGMGIALLGTVMNAQYAAGVAHADGVSDATRSSATHSLGEALQRADQLGGTSGELLRSAARGAFVDGMHTTLLVSAALLVLGALAALRLPRTVERPGTPVVLPGQERRAPAAVTAGARSGEGAESPGDRVRLSRTVGRP